jgi:tripartite ATP-independent transporter DctM subunit
MIAGAATPTELGAICVVYGVLLAFYYHTFSFKMIIEVLEETLIMVGILVFVITVAFPFSWLIATHNVPTMLIGLMKPFLDYPYLILLILNLILLFLGMFMETTAILLIMVPVLFPLVDSLGVDPVHFGLIVIINLLIGAVTPPFGMCLYVVTDIAKVPFSKVVKATMPFLVPLLFTLLLVTYVPQTVLWLPNLLFK